MTALAAAVCVFGASYAFGNDAQFPRLLLTAALCIELSGLFTAISSSQPQLMLICYSLYMTCILIVPGIMQAATGVFPFFAKEFTDIELLSGSSLVLVFCAVAHLSYWTSRNRISANTAYRIGSLNRTALVAVIIILTVAALTGFLAMGNAYYTTRRGELSNYFVGSPRALFIGNGARYAAFFAAIATASYTFRQGRVRAGSLILFIALAALSLYMNNPLNIPRTLFVSYILSSVIMFGPIAQKRVKMAFASAYALALLTIMPALSQLSRGERGGKFFLSLRDSLTRSGDLDSFQSLLNVQIWTDHVGLKWGKQIASAMLVFIPRAWWPTKATGTGGEAAAYMGYLFINVSAPLPSEFYADFGYFGAIFGAGLFGLALAIGDQHIHRGVASKSPLYLAPFATFAALLGIILRGSLLGVIGLVGLAVLVSCSLRFALTKRSLG